MAEALALAYAGPKPAVVRNVFPWAERERMDGQRKDRPSTAAPSLHWFSQTMGTDRGLELLLAALPLLKSRPEVYLRGNCSMETRAWIHENLDDEWRGRLVILPTVAPDELLSRIAEHDLGLALESHVLPNHNLTISNKFFQYLQAGLPVIATDTQGQREAFHSCPEVGTLLERATPEALAAAVDHYFLDPERLRSARRAALMAAAQIFSWEREKAVVVQQIARALADG